MKGAPQKRGINSFLFDVDFYEDDKLFNIQDEYGPLGESVYSRLLCLVYKNGWYYKFDSIEKVSQYLIRSIGNKWAKGIKVVSQVIYALVEVGLFDKKLFASNIITSGGIQRRYLKAVKRRQLLNNEKEYWLLVDENSEATEFNVTENPLNVDNKPFNVDDKSINVDNNSPYNKLINELNKEVGEPPSAHRHGLHNLVVLTESEYNKLLNEMGGQSLKRYINQLDGWLHSGKPSKLSHASTIYKWWSDDTIGQKKAEQQKSSEMVSRDFTTDELKKMIPNYGEDDL